MHDREEEEIANSIHGHAFNLHLLIDKHADHVAHDLLKLSPPVPIESIRLPPARHRSVLRDLRNGIIPPSLFAAGEYPTRPFKRELVIGPEGDLKIRFHIDPKILFKVHRAREQNVTKAEFERYITANRNFINEHKRGITEHSNENPDWAQQLLDRFKQPTVFEYTSNVIKEFTYNNLVLEIPVKSLAKSRETRAKKERRSKADDTFDLKLAQEHPALHKLSTEDYEITKALALIKRLRIAHDAGQSEKKVELEKQLLCHHEDGPNDHRGIQETHIVYE